MGTEVAVVPALASLVVLFHPAPEQLRRIGELAAQGAPVLVVDNSPVPDVEAARALAAAGIELLHHGNRNGLAGAYNLGLRTLFARGCPAVVLFDQDSQVPAHYMARMQAFLASAPQPGCLAGPRIFDQHAGRFLPELEGHGWRLRRMRLGATPDARRCAFLISSGCLVSRDAYASLGPLDESLFIDHVDTEYCLRALTRGIPLFLLPDLVLEHRIGVRTHHHLGPLPVTTTNHPWFRRYYSARNAMHLARRYGLRHPVALVPNLVTAWQLALVGLFESDRPAKLKSALYGLIDGLQGRLGPIEQRRPGLAARYAQRGVQA